MHVRYMLALVAAFAFTTNVPGVARFHSLAFGSPVPAAASEPPPAAPQHPVGTHTGRLGDRSKIEIIRYVDGEYAKAVLALPHSKNGFAIHVGKPVDVKRLQDMVRTDGLVADPGDKVQITKISFDSKKIVFEINGGGKKHFHLRDHLQVSMGMGATPVGTDSHPEEGRGTSLILDFGRTVPDMSPEEVKEQLAPLLDFKGESSAAVNWVDTLPPEFRKDIANHEAAVGMDEQMVLAALGRADRKVRERDPQGNETEDWIYGDPPAKTTFVTFMAGKVVRVKVFE
jgi:hypothetical protein